MNWNDRNEPRRRADGGGVRQLISDVTELVELQARLISDDVRLTATSLIKPLLFIILSMVIILGIIPVLVLASANVLVEYQQWSREMAQFTCAGIALLVAVGLGSFAVQKLRNFASPLRRSMSELEKNLNKLRDMISGEDFVGEGFKDRDGQK